MIPTCRNVTNPCPPTDLTDLMITVAMETPRSCISSRPEATRLGILPHSLDLGDISRTQRRVAALLGVHTPHGGLGLLSRPQRRCKICRRKMEDGSGHRHVFTYAESEQFDDDTSEQLIDRYTTFGKSKRIVIPSERTVRQDSGDLLPYLSERTITMSSSASKSEDLVLPTIDGNLVSGSGRDEDDTEAPEVNEYFLFSDNATGKYSALIREPAKKDKRPPKPTTIFTDLTGLGPWVEEDEVTDSNDEECYRHDDEVSYKSNSANVDEKVPDEDGRVSRDSRQSFKTKSGNEASRIRRDSDSGHQNDKDRTPMTSGQKGRPQSNVPSQNPIWCECFPDDLTLDECRECFKKGGHERWCKSQTGVCPECGKPIKGMFREKTKSSHSLRKSPTKMRTNLSLVSHNSGLCSAHSRSEHQISSESTSLLKPDKKQTRRKSKSSSSSHLSVPIHTKEGSMVRSKRYCRVIPGVNPSLPSFDPDIHRHAYVLALSTSRVYKMKNDPWGIESNVPQQYFSYFPLWRNPVNKPEAEGDSGVNQSEAAPKIGIRRQEHKLKVKDPMKHILGSLKLGDFYPNGKMFPKTPENKGKDVN